MARTVYTRVEISMASVSVDYPAKVFDGKRRADVTPRMIDLTHMHSDLIKFGILDLAALHPFSSRGQDASEQSHKSLLQ